MSEFSAPIEGREGAPEESQPKATERCARPGFTRDQVARWQSTYQTGRREIYRWIERGRGAQDPAPLDDPIAMPAWWARHSTHRVPSKLLEASIAAHKAAALAAPPAPADSTPAPDPLAGAQTPAGAAPVASAPVPGEPEEVTFTRSMVLEYQRELHAAMAVVPREEARITFWANKHNDAVELLKKQKADAREAAKTSGLMIPRAEVESEIFGVIKMLLNLQTVREKRVREHLLGVMPSLPDDLMEHLTTALAAVAARELDLFRNLQAVQSPDDVFRLAA